MFYILLAGIAGAAIAIQASMNAQLGVLIKSPILATSSVLLVSGVYMAMVYIVIERRTLSPDILLQAPWYLWTIGGVFSVLGVGLSYFLIPKMGIGNLMSIVLTCQLIISMLINHFGWFGSVKISLTLSKGIGVLTLLFGTYLVNKGSGYA